MRAALIIYAVSHLMKVAEMRRYYRLVPREFWLGMLTLAGVIVLDVLPGLIIGVVFCILLVVYRASRIPLSELGADPRGKRLRRPAAPPGSNTGAGRAGGAPRRTRVANAQSVQDTIESLVAAHHPDHIHTVVIDLDFSPGDSPSCRYRRCPC